MTDRLPPFDPASASDEQKAVLAEILGGPRGNLNGPFVGWIASPSWRSMRSGSARSAAIAPACRCGCRSWRSS
jgi:hypothetical protein